jgi:hypothetical protein
MALGIFFLFATGNVFVPFIVYAVSLFTFVTLNESRK